MQGKIQILIVDDDGDARETLGGWFAATEEFQASTAGSGSEALAAARDGIFHAIVLDIALPDMDGREICRAVRQLGQTCVVVVLTARDADSDMIAAFDAGANDYVVKPFSFPVLLARLRAHLRRQRRFADAALRFGPYGFTPGGRTGAGALFGPGDREVPLRDREVRLLHRLWLANGEVVSIDQLGSYVWGPDAGISPVTLGHYITSLRGKIEPRIRKPAFLVSDPGGYRLTR